MASIESLHSREKRLTVYKVKGLLSAEEMISAIKTFYTEYMTFNVLLDLTEADLSIISTDEIIQTVRGIRTYADARAGGRTGLEYGLGRMSEAFYEMENIPIKIKSFRSLEKAEAWLGINISSIFGRFEKASKLGRGSSSGRQMNEV